MPFNPPKTFGQPDVLKTITPAILIQLLKPCQVFLESVGLPLPEVPDVEIDYLRLAAILANPDERMDSHVIEGLHVVTTVGIDANFDELLDIARRNFIEVDRLRSGRADLAGRAADPPVERSEADGRSSQEIRDFPGAQPGDRRAH
jgi:hypothetical protein